MNKYPAFILTHGRPDNQITYNTLRKVGYTGDIILVLDDEDNTINEYKNKYNDIEIFCKKDYIKITDGGDNSDFYKSVVYARNAVWDIAKKRNYKKFIVMDDDYTEFFINDIYTRKHIPMKNFDKVSDIFFKYLDQMNIHCLAFCQGGDFLGGFDNDIFTSLGQRRKAMNVYFYNTEKPIYYLSKGNDDVTTYVNYSNRGYVFISNPYVSITQIKTQKSSGGLTEMYKTFGTYIKSFYSVMFNPSCVKISTMGKADRRIHHKINWSNAIPMIIEERYKK